ncbi:hypothetical protein ACFSYH_04055 [Populibacterium corticicola]|uniref:Uncharacterized protein n=2 Tax=Populibacterium corticicola TaxID=1812826 RepID=A0ABW5XET1_9MICO
MKTPKYGKVLFACFLAAVTLVATSAQAVEDETKYRLGEESLVNAGTDSGFSGTEQITKDDVHWGWQLGNFYVNGFTRVAESDGVPVFLKNVGDEVALWFELEQDIDRINDNESLTVAEDRDGWDQKFQVEQQNFGRGMLIVKHTDHSNESKTTLYSNFLEANASTTAATQIELFEEGDYEVALDYELRTPRFDVFGWKPSYKHTGYQISFEFAVRNGNSMVFPFDVTTGAELTNSAVTSNGFRLDLAKSRYLDIDIKREVLNDSRDGLIEDIRFNKPARDGSQYVEEGTYTITASNRYTEQYTVKMIYVGTDDVLKAHAATGMPIEDINDLLAEGALISEDGSLIPVSGPAVEAAPEAAEGPEESFTDPVIDGDQNTPAGAVSHEAAYVVKNQMRTPYLLIGIFACAALVGTVVAFQRKRKLGEVNAASQDGES